MARVRFARSPPSLPTSRPPARDRHRGSRSSARGGRRHGIDGTHRPSSRRRPPTPATPLRSGGVWTATPTATNSSRSGAISGRGEQTTAVWIPRWTSPDASRSTCCSIPPIAGLLVKSTTGVRDAASTIRLHPVQRPARAGGDAAPAPAWRRRAGDRSGAHRIGAPRCGAPARPSPATEIGRPWLPPAPPGTRTAPARPANRCSPHRRCRGRHRHRPRSREVRMPSPRPPRARNSRLGSASRTDRRWRTARSAPASWVRTGEL